MHFRDRRVAVQKEVPKEVYSASEDVSKDIGGGFRGPLEKSAEQVGDRSFARVKQSEATSVVTGRHPREVHFFKAQEDSRTTITP